MKKIYSTLFLAICTIAMAQEKVGINIDTPKATLHITDPSIYTKDGVIENDGVIKEPHKKVGIKIPSHASYPQVSYTSTSELNLSEKKNGMLIHTDLPAIGRRKTVQGFYYWDHNNLSWENIIDNREVNLDTSKALIVGKRLDRTIQQESHSDRPVILDDIASFSPDSIIDGNELIILKEADYYLFVTGSINKSGEIASSSLCLDIKKDGTIDPAKSLQLDISIPNGNRNGSFYGAKIVKLDKNDRASIRLVIGSPTETNKYDADLASPIVVTLIKLN